MKERTTVCTQFSMCYCLNDVCVCVCVCFHDILGTCINCPCWDHMTLFKPEFGNSLRKISFLTYLTYLLLPQLPYIMLEQLACTCVKVMNMEIMERLLYKY